LSVVRIRGLLTAMSGVVALSLVFLVRHLWPAALADARHATASGLLAWPLGVLWVAGLLLLLLGPFLLAGLSVATYVGTPRVSRTRLASVIGLRLLAFLLALTAVWRPALARSESDAPRSLLYIVVDRSRSMTITD